MVSDLEAAAEQQKAEAAASAAGEAAAVQRIRALYDSNLELREHFSTVQVCLECWVQDLGSRILGPRH